MSCSSFFFCILLLYIFQLFLLPKFNVFITSQILSHQIYLKLLSVHGHSFLPYQPSEWSLKIACIKRYKLFLCFEIVFNIYNFETRFLILQMYIVIVFHPFSLFVMKFSKVTSNTPIFFIKKFCWVIVVWIEFNVSNINYSIVHPFHHLLFYLVIILHMLITIPFYYLSSFSVSMILLSKLL